MVISKRRLGITMWILSPVFLSLSVMTYMRFALGSALGPMNTTLLFSPISFAIIAGIFSVAAYLWSPPRKKILRIITLLCFTIPTTILAVYSTYMSAMLGYFYLNKDDYGYVTIHGSSSALVPGDVNGIFTQIKGCLTNGLGKQKSCDNVYYLYVHPMMKDGWSYAGGGSLVYIFKEKNSEGYITRSSETKEFALQIERGPSISIGNDEVSLNNGDLIVVTIDSNWNAYLDSGAAALNELSLPDSTTEYITSCLGGKCTTD